MGTTAATIGATGHSKDHGQVGAAGGEYNAALGLEWHDHATTQELADSSVRCMGLGARLLATSDRALSHGPGFIVIIEPVFLWPTHKRFGLEAFKRR